ncbi:hypothetical protein CEXT_609901, partial [Caerostris extrusa]
MTHLSFTMGASSSTKERNFPPPQRQRDIAAPIIDFFSAMHSKRTHW